MFPVAAMCKICELAFDNEPALLCHMKSTHKPGEMPYACQVRRRASTSTSSLFSVTKAPYCFCRCASFARPSTPTSVLTLERPTATPETFCVGTASGFCTATPAINSTFPAIRCGPINSWNTRKTWDLLRWYNSCLFSQKKQMLSCDKCRLHFLYVRERAEHKALHHNTHVTPPQLSGLKPGTKVRLISAPTVRNQSNRLSQAWYICYKLQNEESFSHLLIYVGKI